MDDNKPDEPYVYVCSVCQRRARDVKRKLQGLPPIWGATVTLELNAYQAANLLYHMRRVWEGRIKVDNGGDWEGEIPIQLQQIMEQAGEEFTNHVSNGGGKFPFLLNP